MLKNTTKRLARTGIIAGLYVVLSLLVFPVASGAIQFRASELLTLLPLIFVEAVPALFIGCFISNLVTGCALIDVIFGSIVTLVAGVLTYLISLIVRKQGLKIFVGGLFPVFLNALLLPLIWVWCYGALEYIYPVQALFLLLSQSVVIYLLGAPTCVAVQKLKDRGLAFFQ